MPQIGEISEARATCLISATSTWYMGTFLTEEIKSFEANRGAALQRRPFHGFKEGCRGERVTEVLRQQGNAGSR